MSQAHAVGHGNAPATVELSANQARRAALAAQGFSASQRTKVRRPFDGALNALHVLQLDSVNVFARSHYLPMFSRHGVYDRERFDAHLWQSGKFTEYWAHEAALIPVADRPLFGWRMHRHRESAEAEGRLDALSAELAYVRQRLAAEGPLSSGDLEREPRGGRGTWWDWSQTKHAVELLFAMGEVVCAERVGFQRRYALAEQFLPQCALGSVPAPQAHVRLVEQAALRLGVGTAPDLADYHRLRRVPAQAAIDQLQQEGILLPATVEGWKSKAGKPERAWVHRDARIPGRLAPDALLTPFDPLVWFRPRAQRLFNFHYRIEIYTPKEKRQFGYYSLPLMVGGRMAGRIDLKADRAGGALLVQAAWREPSAPQQTPQVAERLLRQAAAWHGLTEVRSTGVGNLALPARWDAEFGENREAVED